MKVCSSCKLEKDLTEFNKNKSKRDGHSSFCRDCSRKKSADHYEKNKHSHKENVKKHRQSYIERNREFLKNYLKEHPCVDCGFSDIRALQFDHIEPLMDSKGIRVPKLLNSSLNRLKEEILKCEVRCANCHMIRTRKQLGWNHYD